MPQRHAPDAGRPHKGKYVAYYRVSTARQGRSGLGLAAQRTAVETYLNGGRCKLLAEFTEIESAKNAVNRPKLQEALHMAKVTGATLVIAKLDRGFRNRSAPGVRTGGRLAGFGFRYNYLDAYWFENPSDSHHVRVFADLFDRAAGGDHDYVQAGGSVAVTRALREVGASEPGTLVGQSRAMRKVHELIARAAPSDLAVLIVGESGTGKELAAETIHALSRRRDGPFMAVNCAAVSRSLIESELFGHERGSFTGATQLHRGYFERASRGTLFLDEVTEMPIELQVKLLRVLETGRIMRVGGDREVEVNVRVIAATNRNPDDAVKDGKLREDLFYRLKVFPITLPPLRDREGDIDTLAQYFLHNLNKREGTQKRFNGATLERLRTHAWPGNVRELQNVVQRAFILGDQEITPDCLPSEMGGETSLSGPNLHLKVGTSLEDAERRLILATLDQYEGDKKTTAEVLGISLKTLYNRLNQYAQV